MFFKKRSEKKYNRKTQMEFEFERPREGDRNIAHGGRSFYFFDFDDNVAFLPTPIAIFHKETQEELLLGSGDYAQNSKLIGESGPYKNYFVNYDDSVGSFRFFRDHKLSLIEKIRGKKQPFEEDLLKALETPDINWQGPCWQCFYHAVFNQRPLSIITARGHDIKTIEAGLELLVRYKHIPRKPNILCIYPVSNPQIRQQLSGGEDLKTPELKQKAIRLSVEKAISIYGNNPYHRFGMSDDDPRNIELIEEEMRLLKNEHPKMSFHIIYSAPSGDIKREILLDSTSEESIDVASYISEQLELFHIKN